MHEESAIFHCFIAYKFFDGIMGKTTELQEFFLLRSSPEAFLK